MNTNVKSICEIVEDIKENITDYQYKTIMDDLMVINNKKEEVKEVQEDEEDEDEDDFRVLNEEDTVNRRLFNNLFNLNKTQYLKLDDKKEFNKRLDVMINDIISTLQNYEEVDGETDEKTDEETVEEIHRQIIFLNGYIPTITDEDLKAVFTRRLNLLQQISTEVS